jgi:hypothetical protein
MIPKVATIGLLIVLVTAPGCTPCRVFGPLQHQRDERELLLTRSRGSGVPVEVLNVIAPPLTLSEAQAVDQENHSCRSAYMWKNALTWTGGVMVAIAAGVTVGGAYLTGNNNTTGAIAFGISAGSLAALGGLFGVGGDMVHQSFTERGCLLK